MNKHKVAITVVILSVMVWFADSIIDSVFFYNEAFTEVGFTNVSVYEIYFRLSIVAVIIIAGYLISLRIKEKRVMKESLEFERVQTLKIYNSIDEPIYVIDPVTEKIIFCNDAAKKIFSEDQDVCTKNIVDHEGNCNTCKLKEKFFKEPDKQIVADVYNSEQDKWFHTINRLVVWFDGNLKIFTFAVDITQLKKSELEMLRTSKFETMEVMADTIIHDFNNILSVAIMNVDMLKQIAFAGQDSERHIEAVENSIQNAMEIIKQLKRFTKDAELNIEETNLVNLIQGTVEFVFKKSKIRYKVNIHSDTDRLRLDKGQIIQVMHNILLNAKQAMDDHGTVTVELNDVKMPGSDRLETGEYVRVSISDDGPGISADNILKIFNPYFTTKTTGTGLGLASCYLIIKKHKGDIEVISEPGKGATFNIYLPINGITPA